MNCYKHPDREAIGNCTSCGKPICSECAVEMQGKLVCRECLETGRAGIQQQSNNNQKDPNTAFLIELVGGLFGLLGLGYFYIGRTNDGLMRLIIFMIYNVIAYIIISVIGAATAGILACVCAPIQLAIQISVAYWSANDLKNALLRATP